MEKDKTARNNDYSHDELLQLVSQVRAMIRKDLAGRKMPPSEEIIREMREERDRQLIDNFLYIKNSINKNVD